MLSVEEEAGACIASNGKRVRLTAIDGQLIVNSPMARRPLHAPASPVSVAYDRLAVGT